MSRSELLSATSAPQIPSMAKLGIGTTAGVIILGAAFVFAPYFTVKQNERSVVTNWGKVDYLADPGFHLRIPIMQDVTAMPIDVQYFQIQKLNTYTIDSQELDANIVFQYRVPVDRVLDVYTNLGPAYADRVASMVVDRFKTRIGSVNAIDLAGQRGKVTKEVLEVIRQEAARLYYGIEIVDFQLINFDWNEAYRTAISNASVAKAKVDQQEQEKRQAEVSAQQAVVEAAGRANASVATAEGAARALRLKADSEAYSTRQAGQANADALTVALKAQTEALTGNPQLVSMQWAQRWNGQMPTSIYGGQPLPWVGATPSKP